MINVFDSCYDADDYASLFIIHYSRFSENVARHMKWKVQPMDNLGLPCKLWTLNKKWTNAKTILCLQNDPEFFGTE